MHDIAMPVPFGFVIDNMEISATIIIVTYSQGGVRFPTGGIPGDLGSPRAFLLGEKSRTGEKPVPTVRVWMKEDRQSTAIILISLTVFHYALILVSRLKN